jgi:hypothetical protein
MTKRGPAAARNGLAMTSLLDHMAAMSAQNPGEIEIGPDFLPKRPHRRPCMAWLARANPLI